MGRTYSGWILLMLLLVPCARAQQGDAGGAIASISAGGLFGLGAHGSVDAEIAAPVSKHFMPFADFTYAPLTSYAFNYGADNTGKALFRSYMLDFNGGFKIRFPSKKSDWVPYIGLGAGALHIWSSTNMSGFGSTATVNASHTDFAGNASVGGLYYINPHVGLKLEAKGYASQHNRFGQATIGVFYQFQ